MYAQQGHIHRNTPPPPLPPRIHIQHTQTHTNRQTYTFNAAHTLTTMLAQKKNRYSYA